MTPFTRSTDFQQVHEISEPAHHEGCQCVRQGQDLRLLRNQRLDHRHAGKLNRHRLLYYSLFLYLLCKNDDITWAMVHFGKLWTI